MPVVERTKLITSGTKQVKKGQNKKAATQYAASPYVPQTVQAAQHLLGVNTQPAAKKKTTKAPAASGGSSYRPYSYSSSGYSSSGYSSGGGGGGGGGGASEYEQYGITKPWMEAYKEYWGSALPQKLWGMYEPITSLFTRYMNRMPQMDDWKAIWEASRQYFADNEIDRQHMPLRLELYEPFIANMVRQPLFTPPDVSYSPGMSF